MTSMIVSDKGLALIREFEGLRLTAYPDPGTGAEPWTIGYGHTKGVNRGDQCTKEQAESWLRTDAQEACEAVLRRVTVKLSQSQVDALTSFVFNLGAGNFDGSTLRKKLNAGDFAGAGKEFKRWNRAAGREMAGLTRRRASEAALFHASPAERSESNLQEPAMPIPAVVAALLPVLTSAVPELVKLIRPDSESAAKNADIAVKVFDIAKTAIDATNEQEVAERVQSDPQAAQAVRQAVQDRWYELVEVGGGVQAAREADLAAQSGGDLLRSPSFWVALMLLPLVYLLVLSLVGIVGTAAWSDDVRAGLAGSLISAIVGGLVGYYYGQTTSRNRAPAA
jgi:lysozyme